MEERGFANLSPSKNPSNQSKKMISDQQVAAMFFDAGPYFSG